jgi:hypothetical protein
LSVERETAYRQQEAPINKPPRTATFAEAIDLGMRPHEALTKCTPATTKQITKERLQICANAGFDVNDIAKAFCATVAATYYYLSKHRIKLVTKTQKSKLEPVKAQVEKEPHQVESPQQSEPIVPASKSNPDPVPEQLAVLPEPVPVPKVWAVPEPVTIPAPPAEPEFVWFDRRENLDTGVLIRESGSIEISAAVSAGLTSDFVKIGVSRDGATLKIVLVDDGLTYTGNGNRRRLNLKALAHELQWAQITLPARYIGAWQGSEWTGHLQDPSI